MKKLVVALIPLTLAVPAFGAEMVQISSPNGVTELCQKPETFPILPGDIANDGNAFQDDWYKKKDVENINDLCAVNFYDAGYGICPKLWSTNPAVEVHQLEKMTKADFEKKECPKPQHRAEEKIAKFKQTVTCSKTASILGYYHVSRWLGNSLHVPVGTYRTMDNIEHQKIVADALSYGPAGMKPFWGKSMTSAIASGAITTKSPEGKTVIYGALSENPGGEVYHQRLNGSGADKEARVASVQSRDFFVNLNNPKPMSEILGGKLTPEKLQLFVYSMDAAEQTLIDAIMEQEDRYGNIHQETLYYYFNEKGGLEEEDKLKKLTPEQQKVAIPLVRVLLKDNDCGMRSYQAGTAFKHSLIKNFKHMNPTTYYRLQWLANLLRDEAGSKTAAEFLKDNALFGSTEFDGIFKKNVLLVADKFKAACKAGTLFLDLDLEAALKGQLPKSTAGQVCE